jgi:uncharacterized protein
MLIGPLRNHDLTLLGRYERFFAELEALPITDAACDRAAVVRAEAGVLLPDALHIALAETHGCDEFWTGDQQFERLRSHTKTQIRLINL